MKPKIFIYITGTFKENDDVISQAIAEDGTPLGQHLSSNIDFAKHDMGLTSNWKHEKYYKPHYPDGYDLEWVENPETHKGLAKAAEKNRKL